ncbi:MAG: hypothetical protein GY940_08170 [bacterium]|nr:hypothetical protein [bacterium]
METSGMGQKVIDQFIEHNLDMVRTVTEEKLNDAAKITGFQTPIIKQGNVGNDLHPLGIFVIRLEDEERK